MVKLYPELFPKGQQGIHNPGYFMDGFLHKQLEITKREINKDWDMCFLVDGMEGSGKSVLAQQVAFFCDPTLTLDRIVFDGESFKKAIVNAKQYQAIIFDEAYGSVSSKQTMSSLNKQIETLMCEIRQKNLFLIIVLPSFFDLSKYLSLWRSRMLLHVYTNGFERGYFRFFNSSAKKNLYIMGKKFYNYGCIKPGASGRFPDFYVVDKEEYKAKKLESLRKHIDDPDDAITPIQIKKRLCIKVMNTMYNDKKFKFTRVDIAKYLNINVRTVGRYLLEEKGQSLRGI